MLLNMKKTLVLTGTVFSAFFGCGQSDDFDTMVENTVKEEVPYIYADSIPASNNYLFLDARELEEYQVSRIPGALFIGYDDFDLSRVNGISPDDTLVVYCSIGYRSNEIAKQLEEAGYQTVFNLYGGLFQWSNDEKPMEDDRGETKKIHGYNQKWSQWIRSGEVILK